MKKKLNPLVFFGTEDFSAIILEKLINSDYQIELVITKPDLKKGRGRKLIEPKVKTLAKTHRIPYVQISSTADLIAAVKSSSCQTGILASFGKIVPNEVLQAFNNGIINVHPSLLPKYRGPSPIEAAILNNDTQTGVSIMKLVQEVDAGAIFSQVTLDLNGNETKAELYQKLADLGGDLLITTLDEIKNNNLQAQPQDDTKATFTKMLNKQDSFLQPEKHTARQIFDQIRAYQAWPKPKYNFFDQTIIILEAKISDQAGLLPIKCQDDKFINVTKLKSPTGKTITAEEFIRGYQK